MTESQDTMVSSEVEVAVDPDTAFTAFTEELDLWWGKRLAWRSSLDDVNIDVSCPPMIRLNSSNLST